MIFEKFKTLCKFRMHGFQMAILKLCQMNTDLFETLQNTTKAGEGGSKSFCTLMHHVPPYQDGILSFTISCTEVPKKFSDTNSTISQFLLIYLLHLINPC